MKLQKGKYYLCTSDVEDEDSTPVCIKGKVYVSPSDDYIRGDGAYSYFLSESLAFKHFTEATPDVVDLTREKGNLVEDNVNHPRHYNMHPSGIKCIEIARHYCFSIGNAIKYLWRAGLKQEMGKSDINKEIEDLEKAKWYIQDRILELKNLKENE